jgi:hypothetical protein
MNFNIENLTQEQKALYYQFMALIDKRGNVRSDMSPCWRWTKRSFSSNGYGQIMINSKEWNAHRYSYYIHNDFTEIEKGKHICHKCDNKECSNPEHLYIGTPKENAKDVWDRAVKVKKEKPQPVRNQNTCEMCRKRHKKCSGGTPCEFCIEKGFECKLGEPHKYSTATGKKGEEHGGAKLTWEQVREIRKRKADGLKYGELKKMATEYDISYTLIQKIVANECWREEPPCPPRNVI